MTRAQTGLVLVIATLSLLALGGTGIGEPAMRAASAVGVLSRPAAPADAVPPRVIEGLALSDGTFDVTHARRVRAGGGDGWIAPGRRGSVCHARRGLLSCPPAGYVAQRGVAPSLSWRDGVYMLDGIAADQVIFVDVTYADGRTVRATVSDNAFSLSSSVAPARVTWQGPAGAESFELASIVALKEKLERLAPRKP